jgi:hypothetical protein
LFHEIGIFHVQESREIYVYEKKKSEKKKRAADVVAKSDLESATGILGE